MVLKRKLPSQLAKEKAAPAAQTSAPENSAAEDAFITDFQAEPAPQSLKTKPKKEAADFSESSVPSDETDQFTADALKEAASALEAEMNTPSTDFGDLDMDDIEPAAKSSKQDAPKESAPHVEEAMELNAPLKDTFAGVDEGSSETPTQEIQTQEHTTLDAVAEAVSDIDSKPETTKTPAQEDKSQEPLKAEQPKEVEKPAAAAEKLEISAGAPSLPQGLKRKNRNKRKRAAVAASDSVSSDTQAPTPKETSKPEDKSTSQKESNKPQDMELATQHKPSADVTKANVDRAFTEMAGVPDPAEQEIEAAYVPPAEVESESVAAAPKPDVSKLLDEVEKEVEKPKKNKSPEEVQESVAETAPTTAVLPPSFADEMPSEPTEQAPQLEEKIDQEPSLEPAPEPVQEESALAKEETPSEVPTVSFAEPQSFADMAEKDKQTAPLPWEEEAQNAAQGSDEDAWEFDSSAPAQDIYSNTQPQKEKEPAPELPTGLSPSSDKAGLSLPFLNKLGKNAAGNNDLSPTAEKEGASGDLPPPELPTGTPIKTSSGSARPLLVLLALGVVGFAGYKIFTNQDAAQDRVARFTGALDQTPETLPSQNVNTQGVQPPKVGSIQPEKIITSDELARLNQELEEDLARLNESGNPLLDPPEPTAQIDFVDVTAEEASQPIVATEDEPLPGEKGFVASLQDAINQEREKRGLVPQSEQDTPADSTLPPEERRMESADLQAQVQAELEAYRKALASQNEMAIKPNDFFGTVDERGVLLPPKKRMPAGAEGLPESEIFTENPYNLPVLAEPETDPVPTVRSLDDFDVAMFEPPKPKVRIPQGLKPRLRASDFPEITALSFVPDKGMIGHANGREGVLLIGEMLEGWELYAVTANHAEFRSGQRKYYVNLE